MRDFKAGELVLLTLDSAGPVGITPGLRRYKDKKFRIKKVVSLRLSTSTMWYGTYYELAGCVSRAGIPYAVIGDWIRPTRESRR